MINETYVSFEVAKLLKEKEFSENTVCKYADVGGITEKWYDDYRERVLRFDWNEGYLIEPLIEPKDQYEIIGDTISAATHQMALKWLREVHNIHITILQIESTTITMEQKYFFYRIQKNRRTVGIFEDTFLKYEQAVEAALKYALENLI